MGEPNQVRWVGVRPTEPEEDIPIKTDETKATVRIKPSEPVTTIFTFTGKLQQKRNSVQDYSLDGNSNYTWLSVSGSGLIQAIWHKAEDITAENAHMFLYIDSTNIGRDIFVDVFIMNKSELYNDRFGSVGRCGFRRHEWDTTNNVYFVHSYLSETYFTESFSLEFRNTSASAGIFSGWCSYQILASTKTLRFASKIKEMKEKEVNELREMINKDYGRCHAVVWCMQSKVIDKKKKKYVNISTLEFLIDDSVFEKSKDKIINRLIKENLI
ncbi:hypothetical protein DRO34_04335 [Candidatus Bathyarchaeota archaeon]|nr:MAG: hypothetical protein DRO34_04335 [Candidatus Bathyarchaeota archaeon]